MHRDLLDHLRCPAAHDEGWLVAMVRVSDGAQLRDGDLACPTCGAEYPLRDGRLQFGVGHTRPSSVSGEGGAPPDDTRVAALLGVTASPWPILLTGAYARVGAALLELVDAPQVWVDPPVDAPLDLLHPMSARVSVLVGPPRLPLGVGTIAAAAVDRMHTASPWIESIQRAVRQGGHLLAPATTPMPTGLRELARDEREWVAEVITPASGLVELRRRA